jgi:hypothetical protein
MAAELNRQDIVDDDLMAAPMVLTKDFEKLLTVLKQVADVGKKVNDSFGGKAPFAKAKEDTEELTKAQQELVKIQNAIATAVARENEEYITYKKQLQEVNQRIKEKTALGERDAKTINAAIEELGAALRKNQQAYSKLRTEEERTSKSGKELLKIIQQQDKEFKELRQSMGIHTDEVGNYTKATEGLDNVLNGAIGRVKMFGAQLLAIAGNPVVLTLATIVGLVVALSSAVKTFFTSTGEGEDMLARQTAVWNQFFNVVKKGWSDLGKSITEVFGEDVSQNAINVFFEAAKIMFPMFSNWIQKMQTDFNATAKTAKDLADTIDDIDTRIARNIVDKSESELKYAKLIFDASQKNLYTDEQRLKFRQDANKLKEDELKFEKQIAEEKAKAILTEIGLGHNLTQAQIDRIDFRRDFNELDKEFTGEEMKRIAEAYAHVNNLEAQYFSEQKKNAAAIDQLLADIDRERLERIARRRREEQEYFDTLVKGAESFGKKAQDQFSDRVKDVQMQALELLKNDRLTNRQRRTIVEDAEREIVKLKKAAAIEALEAQIKSFHIVLNSEKLTAQQRIEIQEHLNELTKQLTNLRYGQITSTENKLLQSLQNAYASFANLAIGISNTITDNRIADIDRQQARLEELYERDLELAGENEAKKSELRNAFDRKSRELELKRIQAQRRAIMYEKVLAGIQAGINVAVAATNQGAKGDPYTALARVAAIVAALTPFVLSITSKQIPAYEVGTDNHPGGLAIVGEKGSELMVSPTGQISLTPDKSTLMNLPAGTEVIPHDETMRMLALSAIMPQYDYDPASDNRKVLNDISSKLDQLSSLERTIRNKREHITNLTRAGAQKIVKNAETRQYLIDQLFR